MPAIAIQLYTLRDVDQSYPDLLRRVAEAGFDGVEFAYRVTEEDPTEVAAVLEETGLAAAGAHVEIDRLEDDLDGTLEVYETIGCSDIVVPWLDAKHFESPDAIDAAGDRLETLEADLADRGFTLHYHNHDHEYVACGDRPGFHAFIDRTTVGLELDLGFVHLAGDDPVERLRSVGDRCSLAHLKDVDVAAGESVPMGEGDLDIEGCADAFADIDGEWLIYEYEGEDPLASLDPVAERMRALY